MGYKKTDPCIEKAYDDEKLFVLMARDPAAAKVILYWIVRSFDSQPTAKLREAFECAIEMRDRCDEFRKRKEVEERDRKEFASFKESRESTLRAMSHGESLKSANKDFARDFVKEKVASNQAINFAQRFADYLDKATTDGHSRQYAKLFEEFIKTLPSQ